MMPDQFWSLTYAEFIAMLDGFRRVQTRKQNELLYVAWHVEAFARQKKLPDLKSIMASDEEKRHEQTDDQMLAMCRMLNAAFGGEVVET